MKVLSFIPARGGSKGVVKKNIQDLNGHPVLAYTICSSLQCELIHRTIVSSEDQEILKCANDYGAEIVERPKEMATDESPTEPSIQHAVNEMEKIGFKPDFIILNQPTAPFRMVKDLKNAIGLLNKDFDAVMSVSPVPAHYHPQWIKEMNENDQVISYWKVNEINHPIIETEKYWQRQQLQGEYFWKNGAIYIMSYESIMSYNHLYGKQCAAYLIPNERIVNIDTELDLEWARFLLKTDRIKLDFKIKKGR